MSKTYFLAPTRDTPPSGPIFLGSVITSPRSPSISLTPKKSPTIATLNKSIHETSLHSSSQTLSKGTKGKAGVWSEFVVNLGIGGEVSGNWENTHTAEYKFDELITRTIEPELEDIHALFSEDAVQKAIKDSRFGSNLYMITGIKIARGADVAISKVKARGGCLNFGIDATPLGVPLTVGPDLEFERSKGQEVTEKHTSDFVFAYRLREIRYKRKVVQGQKEYRKGDLMGHGEGDKEKSSEDEDEDEDETEGEAELIDLKSADVKGDAWDLDVLQAVDEDGQNVNCVKFEDDEED